ncbi:alpha/beta fold hydrolase [Robertmurraya korlensis]|uniref:alpha/beta hydrolase n=1 Tax=Robertmurraya korlensis TaxID=519977 RepID=UPI00203B8C58|nr:alpha/beta fold hydrolase [Robertmurraya korlensis]MCM3601190.1 alpha/beta fold hydrolase [Robertmurraya korlensis]
MAEKYPVLDGAEAFFFKGNDIGILISHGFIGTPQSVRYLGEGFAKQGFTVLGPRLHGHGTHYKDLEECTNHDWFQSLEKGYQQLRLHCHSIFVIGQSMGGTLTLWLAKRYPDIKGIITVNAALEVPSYEYLKGKIEPRFLNESAPDLHAKDVVEIAYPKVPIKAIHELQKLMEKTPSILPDIQSPVLGIHSAVDHVVPPANTDYILRNIGSSIKERVVLQNSYHVASMDYDKDVIVSSGIGFIEQLLSSSPISP